jgi:hypothetical protein
MAKLSRDAGHEVSFRFSSTLPKLVLASLSGREPAMNRSHEGDR